MRLFHVKSNGVCPEKSTWTEIKHLWKIEEGQYNAVGKGYMTHHLKHPHWEK